MQNSNMLSTMNNAFKLKFIFIGDYSTGKTSILKRIITGEFDKTYEPTIGVDYNSKIIYYKDAGFKINIWDSAGQEKYKSLAKSYVKNANIIFIVYDVNKESSFTNVKMWYDYIKESIDEKKVKFILIGNKIDLEKKVSTEQGKKLADEYDMLFFEVSAKKNDNMKKMFYHSILEVSYFDEILKTQSKDELFKELIEENEGNLSKVDIISNHNSMIFDGVKTTGLNLNSVRSINDEKTEENKKEKNSCCMKKNNTK